MRVVICGGGVIGACAAYFLSRRGVEVIVAEGTEIAAAASGKAGGFLALDSVHGHIARRAGPTQFSTARCVTKGDRRETGAIVL